MSDENHWRERAESAETKFNTLKQSIELTKERIQNFKANFGIKERSNGEIVIDYQKFVGRLGFESALELHGIIEECYPTKKKPRMKVLQ